MEIEVFSKELQLFSGTIENLALRDSLKSLSIIQERELPILQWDEMRIAVPIKLRIELPSLGNYNDIDIRECEPLILVFSLNDYPAKAPIVFSDRLDFPKDKLAHLYIAQSGRPPAFCYVRGDSDEWYANKRIDDLVVRVRNWLRDAAVGNLTEDGGQFEPLRLEGYNGIVVYDYDKLANIIHEKMSGDLIVCITFTLYGALGFIDSSDISMMG